ncbi:hypothetical protein FJTKL_07757 [Diaporthe vaccinii]|uniref:Altered inheritance of mitochondria protein 41 n=1 Tax=Diaporthe vaccinii TaxID=105482 RepID=A0ABR4FD83_9PEZI
MASNFSSRAIQRLASSQFRQPTLRLSASPRCLQTCRQYSAEASPTPPLLAKFKTDLKTAMRAKDAARLSVLRTILSATNNAAKTSSPIKTDVQLVQLLRKTARGNHEAAEEARAAGREDLIAKEEAQVKIIDEYIADSGVQTLGKDEIRAIVEKVISEIKNDGVDEKRISGELFKRLMAKDGPLEGKEVDRSEIAQIAKELTKDSYQQIHKARDEVLSVLLATLHSTLSCQQATNKSRSWSGRCFQQASSSSARSSMPQVVWLPKNQRLEGGSDVGIPFTSRSAGLSTTRLPGRHSEVVVATARPGHARREINVVSAKRRRQRTQSRSRPHIEEDTFSTITQSSGTAIEYGFPSAQEHKTDIPTKESGTCHNTARVEVQALRSLRYHATLVFSAESVQRHEYFRVWFLRCKSHASGSRKEMGRNRRKKLRQRCIFIRAREHRYAYCLFSSAANSGKLSG